MVHIELSSRGRDTIALEMPDISYFSTNRSGGLEENCLGGGEQIIDLSYQ